MHTTMDIHDLMLTAEEWLESLARATEALALDSVYAYFEDGMLTMQFPGDRTVTGHGDPESGALILRTPERSFPFLWDDVEERWLLRDGGFTLFAVAKTLISEYTGTHIEWDSDV